MPAVARGPSLEPDRIGTMGGCRLREGVETALRGPSHLDSGALVPVPPLLVATVPVARTANPSEAFCGVETCVSPVIVLHRAGLLQSCLAPQSGDRTAEIRYRSPETAKAPYRKACPESALALRILVVTETLDSRRPLIPQALESQEFAACRTFAPCGPAARTTRWPAS